MMELGAEAAVGDALCILFGGKEQGLAWPLAQDHVILVISNPRLFWYASHPRRNLRKKVRVITDPRNL